jgi:hypothetical protein
MHNYICGCVKEKRPFGGRLRRTVSLFDTHYNIILWKLQDARTGDVIFVARVCATARQAMNLMRSRSLPDADDIKGGKIVPWRDEQGDGVTHTL